MTLLRAVGSAKGLDEFADQRTRSEDVGVVRTVSGQDMAGLHNAAAISRGLYDDPPIYANDVMVPGDPPRWRPFRDFVSPAPLLATPFVAHVN